MHGSVFLAPACICASVADGTYGIYAYEQSVVVAIVLYVYDMEVVAACLALCPCGLARTAPEGNLASHYGQVVGLTVHVSEHKNLSCLGILYDGRYEALHLVKIYFHFINVKHGVVNCSLIIV